ncbi:MAG: hypothetical protein DSZ27_06070 [Thiomicrospira sp.]|nr:MAG: hypothetical protein DSZ27_06070 [Thiomicrospira sp.]
MGKDLIQKKRQWPAVLVICMGAFLSLTACSQLSEKPAEPALSPASKAVQDSEESTAETQADLPTAKMSPQTMYQILLAEMLVQKGKNSAAFGVLYPVAMETRDPKLAERVFQLSMSTYDLTAIKESAKLWRDVSPDEAVAWKASYLMSVREGNIEEGIGFWKRYQALSKNTLEQDLIAASIRVPQTAPAEYGLPFLSAVHQLYPEEPAGIYGLGSAAETYGDYKTAIQYLEQAASLYQSQVEKEDEAYVAAKVYREINRLLANAYLKSNQVVLGLKRLKDYVDEYDDDWLMQERYARLEVKAGFYQQAEKRYLRIIKNEPKAYTSKLSVALLRLERDDFARAEQLLKDLKEVPQYRSTALYYLGISAQEQNHLKQAKAYYELIQSQDYLVDAKLHIAEIDFSTIGLKQTIQNLDAVKASSPDDQIKLYRGKAVFYNLAGQKEKAIEEYNQALAVDKNQVELYLMQAMLFYDLEQYDRYEANLQQALSINPNDVDVLNALGYFYAEQKRKLDQATELLDKALSLAPDRYYILDSRGWLAYQKGQYEQAESYLKRALDIQLDDEVLIHLIHTQWRLNKKSAATRLWKKYHSKFPDNQRLQRILLDLSS